MQALNSIVSIEQQKLLDVFVHSLDTSCRREVGNSYTSLDMTQVNADDDYDVINGSIGLVICIYSKKHEWLLLLVTSCEYSYVDYHIAILYMTCFVFVACYTEVFIIFAAA